jgi:hypothetical protein
MTPEIIQGSSYKDNRGSLNYNNSFNLSTIKRMYVIGNNLGFTRRWQGHKIEQRWFSAIKGNFEIQLIKVDDWEKPSKNLEKITFNLSEEALDFLHIPAGYISSIKSFKEGEKLLVMSDYTFGEVNDDYKYAADYFVE